MNMKTKRLCSGTKSILVALFTAAMIISFNSYAAKPKFLPSSVVPSTEGYAKVKKDKNNNYAIEINLYNLPEANRLDPPKKTYVVWMVTQDDMTKNMGQINTSKKALSRTSKSSFNTVSPSKPVKIFITAEDEALLQDPGRQQVISTDRF
jgi:hypothetical protein